MDTIFKSDASDHFLVILLLPPVKLFSEDKISNFGKGFVIDEANVAFNISLHQSSW